MCLSGARGDVSVCSARDTLCAWAGHVLMCRSVVHEDTGSNDDLYADSAFIQGQPSFNPATFWTMTINFAKQFFIYDHSLGEGRWFLIFRLFKSILFFVNWISLYSFHLLYNNIPWLSPYTKEG